MSLLFSIVQYFETHLNSNLGSRDVSGNRARKRQKEKKINSMSFPVLILLIGELV
jgi:hypothetical protein